MAISQKVKNLKLLLHFFDDTAIHGAGFIGTPKALFNKEYFVDDYHEKDKWPERLVTMVLNNKDITNNIEKVLMACHEADIIWWLEEFSRYSDMHSKDTIGLAKQPYGIYLSDYKKIKTFLAWYYEIGLKLFTAVIPSSDPEQGDMELHFLGFVNHDEVAAIMPVFSMPMQSALFDV